MNTRVHTLPGRDERPYSAEELGERWGCSAQHIRDLVRTGRLRAFRAGRLIRIPAAVVRAFENGESEDGEAVSALNAGAERASPLPFVPRGRPVIR